MEILRLATIDRIRAKFIVNPYWNVYFISVGIVVPENGRVIATTIISHTLQNGTHLLNSSSDNSEIEDKRRPWGAIKGIGVKGKCVITYNKIITSKIKTIVSRESVWKEELSVRTGSRTS